MFFESELIKRDIVLFLILLTGILCSLILVQIGLWSFLIIAILVLVIVSYRNPMLTVYVYLMATPFDHYSLFKAIVSLSLADMMAINLLIVGVMRPRIFFVMPWWYIVTNFGILLALTIATGASGSYQNLVHLRAISGKIIAAYLATAFIFEYKQSSKAISIFCFAISASIALGIIQEIIWAMGRGNWTLLLKCAPPNSVIGISRIFPDLLLRVPGGTAHPVILGNLASFVFGVFIVKSFLKRGRLTYNILILGLCIIGFIITETRSTVIGIFGSFIILSIAYSPSKGFSMYISAMICLLLFPIFIALILVFQKYGSGLRIHSYMEMVKLIPKFFLGMGAQGYISQSSYTSLHSTPLQIFSDTGLLGVVSYIFLIIKINSILWKRRSENILFLLALCGGAAYLIPTLFLHPFLPMRDHWVILGLMTATACAGSVPENISLQTSSKIQCDSILSRRRHLDNKKIMTRF